MNADFRGKGASPTNHSWYQSSRVIVLSCGIKISAVRHLVLSQYTRLTDGTDGQTQTNGQTEFRQQYRGLHYMQSHGKNASLVSTYSCITRLSQGQSSTTFDLLIITLCKRTRLGSSPRYGGQRCTGARSSVPSRSSCCCCPDTTSDIARGNCLVARRIITRQLYSTNILLSLSLVDGCSSND